MPYTLVSHPGGTAKPDGESLPDPQQRPGEEDANLERLYQQIADQQAEIERLRARLENAGHLPEPSAAKAGAGAGTDAGADPGTDAGADPAPAAQTDEKDRIIHDLLVRNAFFSSEFLREKTVLPPDFAYAYFARNFSVRIEKGKTSVLAVNESGGVIMSRKSPGKPADPEEAIMILIERHPQRDALIKASAPAGGSGAMPHARGGGRLLPDQISRLSPGDYAKARKDGRI